MIRAIADGWGRAPMPGWPESDGRRRDRRRGRPAVVTREHVSIGADAAEMAAFDAFDHDDAADEDACDVTAHEVAAQLLAFPNMALATQARMGAGVVRCLITVNAINRL